MMTDPPEPVDPLLQLEEYAYTAHAHAPHASHTSYPHSKRKTMSASVSTTKDSEKKQKIMR